MSGIYETCLTGSEWGNLAAHKFGLQALVDFLIFFFGGGVSYISPRGLIGLLTKMGKNIVDPFFDPPWNVFGQKMGL